MTTFLLGLSVGGGCLTHCGPVLLPLLLCEDARRWRLAFAFLAARLCGYVLVATAVFAACHYSGGVVKAINGPLLEAVVFLLLGILLLRYSLNAKREVCGGTCAGKDNAKAFERFRKGGARFALRSGFLTGLGLCAPMVAIIAEGARQETFLGTLAAFLFFFLGTTAVLVPLFACGFACGGKTKAVREIGFVAGLIAAAFYLLQGSFLIITEIAHGFC
jgi:hypothetical protein